MICCGCKAQCAMSTNGLCRGCRQSRGRIQDNHDRRSVRRLYCGEKYSELLEASGLTRDQVVERAFAIRKHLLRDIPRWAIYALRLDNPYMSVDARKVLVNAHRRDKNKLTGKKKSVQSVRTIPQRQRRAA